MRLTELLLQRLKLIWAKNFNSFVFTQGGEEKGPQKQVHRVQWGKDTTAED